MVHYHFKQFHAINSFPCLHLSQPAVTAHLRRLEEIVGKPLVSRSTRGVKLTTHGHALRQRAVDGRCHGWPHFARRGSDGAYLSFRPA